MKKLLVLLLVLCAGIVGAAYYIKKNATASPGDPKIEKVERGNIVVKVTGSGKTVPKNIHYVGLDLPQAKVLTVEPTGEVRHDVRVAKGTPLATLGLTTIEAIRAEVNVARAEEGVAAAEAGIREAEAAMIEADESYKLASQKVPEAQKAEEDAAKSKSDNEIARKKYESAKEYREFLEKMLAVAEKGKKRAEAGRLTANAKKVLAEAELKAARAMLGSIEVKAPIDGYILEKKIIPGQPVSAQATPVLFAMVPDLEAMEVVVPVAESDVVKIKRRMDEKKKLTVTILFDAHGESEFEGEVAFISNVPATRPARTGVPADLAAAAGPLQTLYNITIDNIRPKGASSSGKPLKAGFTANVEFVVSEIHDVLRVPTRALNYTPEKLTAEESAALKEKQAVGVSPLWLWENGKHRLIFVRRGQSDGQWTQIEAIDPNHKLTPGVTEIIVEPPVKKEPGFVVRTT